MDELIAFGLSNGYKDISASLAENTVHRMGEDNELWFIYWQGTTLNGTKYHNAVFGNWKNSSLKLNFKSKGKYTKEDNEHIKAQQDLARIKAKKIKQDEQERVALKASADYTALKNDADSTDYIQRKQIKSKYTAKINKQTMHVAMYDVNKKIWGYQRINQDGSKFFLKGQRIDELFHVIPNAAALDNAERIYLTEGFATAATIYEATGTPTVVAFNSNNLKHVYRVLRHKEVIVCCDDDIYKPEVGNAGREAGEFLIKTYQAQVILPRFKDLSSKPTDFNDLFSLEGNATVVQQLTATKHQEKNKLILLGYNKNHYFYYTTRKKQPIAISAAQHTQNSLMELMTEDEFAQNDNYCVYAEDGSYRVDYLKIANDLISRSQRVGVFKPENIVGAGAVMDGNQIVFNLGNKLYINGELKEFSEYKSSTKIYSASKQIQPPQSIGATNEDMNSLSAALQRLSFKHPETDVKILLGWLFLAPIAGALPWRPHVWLTARSGAGKSYIYNHIVMKLLKGVSYSFMGSQTTEAGIRQTIGSDSLPILMDELETDDRESSMKVQKVLELFRLASSDSSSGVAKGSANGMAVQYTARFATFITSIRANLERNQDRNRFISIELIQPKENNFMGAGGIEETFNKLITPDFAGRMFKRAIDQVEIIKQNRETLYPLIADRTKSSRIADQYAVVIGSYLAALQDDPVDSATANMFISNDTFGVDRGALEMNNSDELECLEHILGYKIPNKDTSLGTIIYKILYPDFTVGEQQTFMAEHNKLLVEYGLKIHEDHLYIRFKHPELKRVFNDTKWTAGWSPTLKRLNGALDSTPRYNGVPAKSVKIPIKQYMLDDR